MRTGRLIKELRLKKGLTQEELANMTELSARTIQRIENGEVDPRSYTLQMIAKALEVDYSLFLDDESEDNEEIKKVDNNNWLALLHLSGLLPLIFPTILLWRHKKEKTGEESGHFRAVITLQLTILGIALVGIWIYWKVNQPTPLIGSIIGGGLLSVYNAIKVMNGDPYINPFIKPGRKSSK